VRFEGVHPDDYGRSAIGGDYWDTGHIVYNASKTASPKDGPPMTPESRGQCSLCSEHSRLLAVALAFVLVAGATHVRGQDDKGAEGKEKKDQKHASLVLKATPPIAFSPARIVVTAELRGGADDTEELYCPGLEWDWGDGTKSESTSDCEPFQAGKSSIQRRFTSSHTYDISGPYRVLLRLRRGSKTIVSGNTSIQVKPGFRDPTDNY
jgi:hypothetical protein